ncbi:MAG: RsmB/NOP family class I SAM-dependent RNA methyltransferase [Paracoccaceae bacterium]
MSAPGLAARKAAITLVHGVLANRRMMSDLAAGRDSPLAALAPQERARAQMLATAVLRHLQPIDAVLDRFLDRPPPPAVRDALRLAAAELLVVGSAAHGAVDSAVRIVKSEPEAKRHAGLVNAVARRIAGEGPALWSAHRAQTLPPPLRKRLRKAWGKGALMRIEAAHAAGAPLDLTLRDAAGAAQWAGVLGADVLPTGSLRLRRGGQVSALPGFAEGAWWVQDAAAAVPARLLPDIEGRRALDLCAAPGGKTMQLAAAGAQVTALDVSAQRLSRVDENLARTGLKAELAAADALAWSPPRHFDAILIDAPCSATGTIRRHPDLPFVRPDAAIAELTALQSALLERAAGWLNPGGRMVFCTCSLLPAEGEDQARAFLGRHRGWHAVAPDGVAGLDPAWIGPEGGLRLRPDYWPELGGMDGFFAIALEKPTAAG